MAEDFPFPTDSEGYTLAKAWFVSIRHPITWLERVVETRGFTPRTQPALMSPEEIRQGIANVLCPPSAWETTGVAVNCERRQDGSVLCHAVLYFKDMVNWEWVRQYCYETHISQARSSSWKMLAFLERGGKGTEVILPPLCQGLPVGDNVAIIKTEAARRRAAERERQKQAARKAAEKRQGIPANPQVEL